MSASNSAVAQDCGSFLRVTSVTLATAPRDTLWSSLFLFYRRGNQGTGGGSLARAGTASGGEQTGAPRFPNSPPSWETPFSCYRAARIKAN